MRGKRVPEQTVQHIYKLRDTGQSLREIAANTGISFATVQSLLKQRISGTKTQLQLDRGRPRTFGTEEGKYLRLELKLHRFESNRQVAAAFKISESTVRRRLKEYGMVSALAKRNYLRVADRMLRRVWCAQHRKSSFRNWIFSDESRFELSDCSGPQRAWCHRAAGHKMDPACILPCGSKCRQGVMVWGAIDREGGGVMCFVEGHINAERYIEVLTTTLLPYLDAMPVVRASHAVFQQDNAPPHRANQTVAFLHECGLTVPRWPAYSPDLNPIENVWAIMKRAVRKQGPRTLPELRDAVRNAWVRVVTPQLCRRLYDSMPARVRGVIQKRGYL